MENAVKALIMVAGLIIGVLVIGLLVYLFRIGGNVASNYEQSMSEGEIASFNAKFEKYITKLNTNPEANSGTNNGYNNLFIQQSNSIHDIVSVINLAYDTNAQLKSSNSTDGLQVELHADRNYYMNAQILFDYYKSTLAGKKRQKNIVFTKEKPPATYDENVVIELNDLVMQYNDSVLYNNGRYNQRIYKTYFDCTDSLYSERGRLYKLVFELVDTKTRLENDKYLDDETLSKIGL